MRNNEKSKLRERKKMLTVWLREKEKKDGVFLFYMDFFL